jgi:hypothetical protein
VNRLASILILACATVCLAAAPAAAQLPTREQVQTAVITELRREEVVPYKTPLLSLHAGFHGDVAAMGELRLGYGKGRFKDSLLFPTMTLWRVSLAARGAYGREDSVALSLLGGWSKVSLFGVSLEAGVDARVDSGDRNLGPIVSGALRVGKLGLHLNTWAHVLDDDTDWGVSVALGINLKDYKGHVDVAKDRAKDRIKQELRERAGAF